VARESPPANPDPAYVAYTSDAYVAEPETEVEAGIELRRRMVQAGIVDVTLVPVADVEMRMDEDELDEYGRQAHDLADRGLIEPAPADDFIESLKSANAAGTYIGLMVIFVAVGRLPGGGPSSVAGARSAS
jgi:hypothetical protein